MQLDIGLDATRDGLDFSRLFGGPHRGGELFASVPRSNRLVKLIFAPDLKANCAGTGLRK
jgi:hypothetical protein